MFKSSSSIGDKVSKIAGFIGMVISITVAMYLIFPAGQAQTKTATFFFSLGIALFLSLLTFKALLKSQR